YQGADVWINGRDLERLRVVQREFAEAGMKAPKVIQWDLSIPGLGELVQNVEPDVLVYSTGGPRLLRLAAVDSGRWSAEFQAQYLTLVEAVTATVPSMLANGWGRVVVLSSRAARAPRPHNILSATLRAPGLSLM